MFGLDDHITFAAARAGRIAALRTAIRESRRAAAARSRSAAGFSGRASDIDLAGVLTVHTETSR